MDITETLAPKSDQLNAEDLLTGPRTVTVEKVTKGSAEQPIDIHLVEFPGRPFKPSKTVRRIIAAAWGTEAENYRGRRMTVYRDPEVQFGGSKVGGIRISHLSDIDKRLQVALTVTRGRRATFVVDPLPRESAATADSSKAAATRAKWVTSMVDALKEADCADGADQLVVIAELAGRRDNPPASLEEVTDAEVRGVVNALAAAKKSNTVGDVITDILNTAAIREAEAAEDNGGQPADETTTTTTGTEN